MKMSKVAKMIGVDRRTIWNWVEHEKLKHLFSEEAKNQGKRELDERDIFVINTIAHLRERGTFDWDEIARQLDGGFLVTGLSIAALDVDTGRTPIQQFTYAAEAKFQLEAANNQLMLLRDEMLELKLEHRSELETERREHAHELEVERHNHAEEKEKLLREMGEKVSQLMRQIGRLEGQVEDLKTKQDES